MALEIEEMAISMKLNGNNLLMKAIINGIVANANETQSMKAEMCEDNEEWLAESWRNHESNRQSSYNGMKVSKAISIWRRGNG